MIHRLFLDETGTTDLPVVGTTGYQTYFVLNGIVVRDYQANDLKTKADQIKFRYWGKTNVIFHSREIGRRENNFAILKDPAVEAQFQKDLFDFLSQTTVKCIAVAVDKTKARTLGWSSKIVYETAADAMIKFFIEFLATHKHQGQVIIESAGTQKDIWFYKKYIHYLANGLTALGLDHKKVKNLLTSISVVSKNNYDIEEQVADLLAYAAAYQNLCDGGNKKIIPNSYEDKMCKIFKTKLVSIGSRNSFINLPWAGFRSENETAGLARCF